MTDPKDPASGGQVHIESEIITPEPSKPPLPPSSSEDFSDEPTPRTRIPVRTKFDMTYLVRALIKYHASDLHIKVGRPPLYRINGKLFPAKMPVMTQEEAEAVIFGVVSKKQVVELEEKRQIDLSFRVSDLGRFRCNVYYQRGTISAAVRMIPINIPNIDSLGVPRVLKELCVRPRGLFLVTGPTGSGKTTTLASLVQYLNENTQLHILTIEDPIEFVYRDLKSSISQREVGSDAVSMNAALISGLRQDPDVIVIGEMRDKQTIQTALTAAETGHLVLSSMHTYDAKGAIERILDVFDSTDKNQIRIQLATTLIGVLCQQLLPRADDSGLVPACEVLVKSPTIENFILRNELDQIPEIISSSNDYYKMQSMNQALEKLVTTGTIRLEDALKCSPNPGDLKLRLAGVRREEGYDHS